eukprot:5307157-Amphidinium_carterae.1
MWKQGAAAACVFHVRYPHKQKAGGQMTYCPHRLDIRAHIHLPSRQEAQFRCQEKHKALRLPERQRKSVALRGCGTHCFGIAGDLLHHVADKIPCEASKVLGVGSPSLSCTTEESTAQVSRSPGCCGAQP